MKTSFKRYEIDPELVAGEIDRQIGSHEKFCRDWPDMHDETRAAYAGFIDEQRTYYSTVRIVRTKSRYRLVYGNAKTKGTGPFKTLREAREWFLNGGR